MLTRDIRVLSGELLRGGKLNSASPYSSPRSMYMCFAEACTFNIDIKYAEFSYISIYYIKFGSAGRALDVFFISSIACKIQ